MPTAGSAGSVPENLNLFPEPGSKSEETGKKQLSKDSILSLYGSQTPQLPAQGRFHGDDGIMPDRDMRTYTQKLFVVIGCSCLGGTGHYTLNRPEHDIPCEVTKCQRVNINVTQNHTFVGSGVPLL